MIVLTIGDQLVDLVRKSVSRPGEKESITTQMMAYVDSCCYEYNFSLQLMADYFKLTPSYASRLFKLKTGQKLSVYVNNKRIQKAKRLLTETSLPLQSIVSQIGYSDVSSFIRKFRQLENITPGEYRRYYRQ